MIGSAGRREARKRDHHERVPERRVEPRGVGAVLSLRVSKTKCGGFGDEDLHGGAGHVLPLVERGVR